MTETAIPVPEPALAAPAQASSTRVFVVSILLLALASMLPGIGAIGGKFFIMDDETMIYKSPYIGDVERGAKPRPFTQIITNHRFVHYAPLHELLIYLQWAVFGFSTIAYRSVSLLLHFGAVLACWQMLKVITRRDGIALGIALAFALHPAQCESVAWVVEQKSLASGLLVFAALAIYFKTERALHTRVILATLFMFLACMFKSPALIVLPVIVLFEILISKESGPAIVRWLLMLPMLAVAILVVKLAHWAHGRMEDSSIWTFGDIVLNLPGEILLYVKISLLPWTASFFHDMEVTTSVFSFGFLGKLLILLAMAVGGGACVVAGSRRLFAFCVLAFVVSIGPMCMTMWAYPAYDRYTYYGLPFLLLAVVLLVEGIVVRLRATVPAQPTLGRSSAMLVVWAVPLGSMAIMSSVRGALFSSEVAVMADAASKAPQSAYPHAALANLLMHEWYNKKLTVEQRQEVAQSLYQTVDRARKCWNFDEYFHTPAILLVASAGVLHSAGMKDHAEVFYRAAASEKRWARFEEHQNRARARLKEMALDELGRAERLVIGAEHPQITSEKAQDFCLHALQAVVHASEMAEPIDGALWLEFRAHDCLRKLALGRGDATEAAQRRAAAIDILRKIPAESQFFAQAQNALKAFEQAP
jgi:hypothetical protein